VALGQSRLGHAPAFKAHASRPAANTPASIDHAPAFFAYCSLGAYELPARRGHTPAVVAHRAGSTDDPLAPGIGDAQTFIAHLANAARKGQAGIGNAAALIAYVSDGADHPHAADVGDAAALIAHLSDAAGKPLAPGIGDAAASIAHLANAANDALAKIITGAVRIADSRGADSAIYLITLTIDACFSLGAADAYAGVLCTGAIDGAPTERQ
jgi:hypothetical protein